MPWQISKFVGQRATASTPVRRYRYDHAVMHGWHLYRVGSFVSWCGQGQEFLILQDADVDYSPLVPILGEAT